MKGKTKFIFWWIGLSIVGIVNQSKLKNYGGISEIIGLLIGIFVVLLIVFYIKNKIIQKKKSIWGD